MLILQDVQNKIRKLKKIPRNSKAKQWRKHSTCRRKQTRRGHTPSQVSAVTTSGWIWLISLFVLFCPSVCFGSQSLDQPGVRLRFSFCKFGKFIKIVEIDFIFVECFENASLVWVSWGSVLHESEQLQYRKSVAGNACTVQSSSRWVNSAPVLQKKTQCISFLF